jgi:AcrR family transcriptional regulator
MSESAKHKLLEAACRVISERGLEGMTTQDVATAAMVSKALLHYHFGTRRELIMAAFEHSDDRAVASVAAGLTGAADGKQQLENLLLAWSSDDPEMQRHWIIWTEMWRWSMFEPELRREVAQRHARFIASISDLIMLGKADGSIAKHVHVDQAAQRLAACSDSFGDQAVIGIKSLGEVRVALVEAVDHECAPVGSAL